MESISQLGLPFFGLTPKIVPEIRKQLFTQIHEIVFYGKGGYDWHTVYNMPIWLRKFTFNKINEHYKKCINNNSFSNKKHIKIGTFFNNNFDFSYLTHHQT